MYTQRSMVLNHPIADVFGFLGRPENWPLIEAGLLEYQHLAGSPGELGTVYLSRQQRRGRIAETRMQVTEYTPNRTITVEGDWANAIKPGGGFLVESVADGYEGYDVREGGHAWRCKLACAPHDTGVQSLARCHFGQPEARARATE